MPASARLLQAHCARPQDQCLQASGMHIRRHACLATVALPNTGQVSAPRWVLCSLAQMLWHMANAANSEGCCVPQAVSTDADANYDY